MNAHSRNRYYAQEFDKPRPYGLIFCLVLIVTVTHWAALEVGRMLQEVEDPRVVYVPVPAKAPLTQWQCTGHERQEYIRTCAQRARSLGAK